uniref:ZSWIM1/3 RNaseH-like domain-containing protein n=1 Tax=Trichobilharzia regenti TaxID=157069 RepID=A0AA85IT61_TRIRE|nr:unnamed protein product [Trichobilharzia regenti]
MMLQSTPTASTSRNISSLLYDVTAIFQRIMLCCIFYTWTQFKEALDTFMKESNTSYRVDSSKKDRPGADDYKFVKFKCTFGSHRAPRGAGFRNRGFKSTSCQSIILVQRKSNVYMITKYKTVHNHPCTASFMSTDVSRRRLSSQEMAIIQPFIERNTDVHEIMDLAHEKFGKALLYNDIKNMRTKINKRKSYQNKWCSRIEIGCLEELLHRLRQTGTVKVLQDNAGFVSKIIFARNDMIDVYHKFPEVVGIDCTYKTNKMGWPLYQFVVTDGFGRGRTVFFALTRRETFADIKEILQTFKRFMVDTSKTLTFTVDCATAQMKALKEEFPSCNIVLCLFHVCKAFRRKGKQFPNQLVKKWLYGMAHTRSYDR